MTRVSTVHEENTMSRGTINRIRFIAGIGIAASGAVTLAGHVVGLIVT
ncbi:MAG: hypothetical protein K1X51_14630 [Rhodospirillaceae bacterium]|nr:hypothetical protein [Rhodospirillaceae bacterium]